MQILKEEEGDAKPVARCEEKRKVCASEVQDQKDKPWRNEEELKTLEEDMPRCERK